LIATIWPELEPLWRAAKSLRAVGGQLHERLGVVFVAVFLCHELDGVKQDLQGRQTLLSIDH
jgi:hypothetical protein